MRLLAAFAAICLFAWADAALAEEPPRVFAEGDWSKPAVNNRGRALRGRLVLTEKMRDENRREIAVFVELQDVSEAVGESMLLFCEMGRTDFRPEYKNGLHCQLHDKNKQPVKLQTFPFGGGTPGPAWVTLPSQASIRLRSTPYGMSRDKAMAICPGLHSLWVIDDGDPNEYFLSGTFTIDPAADRIPVGQGEVWRGTLELPVVRIVNKRK